MHNGKNCYEVIEIGLNEPSSISDIKQSGFRLFPNPAKIEARLELNNAETPARMQLLDLTGKLVLRSSFTGSILINTTNLNPGVYLVQVSTGVESHLNRLLVVH